MLRYRDIPIQGSFQNLQDWRTSEPNMDDRSLHRNSQYAGISFGMESSAATSSGWVTCIRKLRPSWRYSVIMKWFMSTPPANSSRYLNGWIIWVLTPCGISSSNTNGICTTTWITKTSGLYYRSHRSYRRMWNKDGNETLAKSRFWIGQALINRCGSSYRALLCWSW